MCGEILTAQEEVAATGHSYDEGKVTTDPTCTEEGVKTFTCAICDDTYTESVDALGHEEEEIPAKAPTCTEAGLTAGVKCSVCGETLTAQEEVAAAGHSYDAGEVTTDPTCTEEGEKTYTCKNDANHTETETVAATGHA